MRPSYLLPKGGENESEKKGTALWEHEGWGCLEELVERHEKAWMDRGESF